MENKHQAWDLAQMQALPLSAKIRMTQDRIKGWYENYDGNVYVSVSGGKDSQVLAHIVKEMYPDVPCVFVNTGLEYDSVRKKGIELADEVLRPEMQFVDVIKKYGYPIISKEVAECVEGAKKYLTSILEENSTLQTDRQTDRQTEHPYSYWYDRLTGQGAYSKFSTSPSSADVRAMQDFTRGGYDNKYRKLRGLGEYATKNGNNAREVQSMESDKGEYP